MDVVSECVILFTTTILWKNNYKKKMNFLNSTKIMKNWTNKNNHRWTKKKKALTNFGQEN